MVQEGKQQVATLPYEAQRGRGRVESPIKYQFFFSLWDMFWMGCLA